QRHAIICSLQFKATVLICNGINIMSSPMQFFSKVIKLYNKSHILGNLPCCSRFQLYRSLSVDTPKVTPEFPKVVFSGIQPTGIPHIGNYIGAIKQWVTIEYPTVYYSIVDLHSITVSHKPDILRENIRDMVACLLACGLDPDKCVLFQQSSIPQHTELAWILGCLTTLPRLQHLPQWKEKSHGNIDAKLGLFTYPVLQSADILLYKGTHVPVGDDQLKHIELARDQAKAFNKAYGHFFPQPQAVIGDVKKIKSLRDPQKKMSKSDPNITSRIDLTDTDAEIRKKIKKATTDSIQEFSYNSAELPGVANLCDIYAAFSNKDTEAAINDLKNLNKVQIKDTVAAAIIDTLAPIRSEILRIKSDRTYIEDVLTKGAEKAGTVAEQNIKEIKKMVGFS
ncbi:unnamed protein product, partial [Owenia fusiformis]